MQRAQHIEGRAFRANEYASAKSVSDARGASLDEVVSLIDADRSIVCECGHSTIGEHNASVTRASVDHGVSVAWVR